LGSLELSSRGMLLDEVHVHVDGALAAVLTVPRGPRLALPDGQHLVQVTGVDDADTVCIGMLAISGDVRMTITPYECTTSAGVTLYPPPPPGGGPVTREPAIGISDGTLRVSPVAIDLPDGHPSGDRGRIVVHATGWAIVDGEGAAIEGSRTWTVDAGTHTVELTKDEAGKERVCAGTVHVVAGEVANVTVSATGCLGLAP
jgi:hypothetical protein